MKSPLPSRVWPVWALVVAVCFGPAGCATLPERSAVGVTLVQFLPTQTSLFETAGELTVRFVNEQPRPLALTGSAHKLYLNGNYVGRAVDNTALTLPQLGTATQVVTLHLENLALWRQAQALQNQPRIRYRLESTLYAGGSDGRDTFRAVAEGELDLSAFAGALGPR